jgi:hypothetical protein
VFRLSGKTKAGVVDDGGGVSFDVVDERGHATRILLAPGPGAIQLVPATPSALEASLSERAELSDFLTARGLLLAGEAEIELAESVLCEGDKAIVEARARRGSTPSRMAIADSRISPRSPRGQAGRSAFDGDEPLLERERIGHHQALARRREPQ